MKATSRVAALLAAVAVAAAPASGVETRKPSEMRDGTTSSTTAEARKPSEMINGVPRPEEGEWLLEAFVEAIDGLHYWEEAGAGFRAMYARISPEDDTGWSLCYGTWKEALGCLWMSGSGLLDARAHVEGGDRRRELVPGDAPHDGPDAPLSCQPPPG